MRTNDDDEMATMSRLVSLNLSPATEP